jgi:dTDP-4-dehydrorhamnose reductase
MLRIAVTGASGRLGSRLVEAIAGQGDDPVPLSRPQFELSDPSTIEVIGDLRPDIVINAAAWTDVDGCARDPELAKQLNGAGAGTVAQVAAEIGALVVQVSTNEVFDGHGDAPYLETDAPSPMNPYGASKRLGEQLVASATWRHMIVRTAWLFGPGGVSFVSKILAAAERARAEGAPLRVVGDEWGNPTATTWLATRIAALARGAHADSGELGIHHLAGQPSTTRARWAARILAGSETAIEEISLVDFPRPSRVPPRAILGSSRHVRDDPHDWGAATDALVRSLTAHRLSAAG